MKTGAERRTIFCVARCACQCAIRAHTLITVCTPPHGKVLKRVSDMDFHPALRILGEELAGFRIAGRIVPEATVAGAVSHTEQAQLVCVRDDDEDS
jgi:hypothetical protein